MIDGPPESMGITCAVFRTNNEKHNLNPRYQDTYQARHVPAVWLGALVVAWRLDAVVDELVANVAIAVVGWTSVSMGMTRTFDSMLKQIVLLHTFTAQLCDAALLLCVGSLACTLHRFITIDIVHGEDFPPQKLPHTQDLIVFLAAWPLALPHIPLTPLAGSRRFVCSPLWNCITRFICLTNYVQNYCYLIVQ